jgi:hypothetical protein
MKLYNVYVPPTKEQGSYKTKASSKQGALADYNSARGHDCLPPMKRMPNGTKYSPTKND